MENNGKKSYDSTSKMQKAQKDAGLFKNGLKSTEMVLKQVESQIFKDEKKVSRGPGERKESKKDLPKPPMKKIMTQAEEREQRKAKLEKIRKKQERMQRQIRGEDVSTDSEEIQALIDLDNLEDDLGPEQYEIKNKEVLLNDDRNNLVKHKTYEQIAAEDPANRKIWGED